MRIRTILLVLACLLLPAFAAGETSLVLSMQRVPAESILDFQMTGDAADSYRYTLLKDDKELFTNKKSKTNDEVSLAMLEATLPVLEGLDKWEQEPIHDALIALAEKLEVKNATLMWPLRIAIAGKAVTPGGAVELCHILGRDEVIRRIKIGMDKLN